MNIPKPRFYSVHERKQVFTSFFMYLIIWSGKGVSYVPSVREDYLFASLYLPASVILREKL